MFKIPKEQLHGMVLTRRRALLEDIEEHIKEFHPKLLSVYPRPYLLWVINDSIDIASRFGIDDVYSMRVFVRLRWEIAPGFYRHPQIASVLSQKERTAKDRFEQLATERFAVAWEEAQTFDDASEWRARFWDGSG